MTTYRLLPFISLIFISCFQNSESDKRVSTDRVLNSDTTENFAGFNARFHSDSAFQLSRVAFPIGGGYVEGEYRREWTRENWEIMKVPVTETATSKDHRHELQETDNTVTEKYWIENSGFKAERRFKKIGGKWFLTHYEEINL